jgi:hypothetical protein
MPDAASDRKLRRDLRALARFIAIYCEAKHPEAAKSPVTLKTHDLTRIAGEPVNACAACGKLLAHAFVKRSTCPLDPKPACKHCPQHCYHHDYRARIREVMKFSGKKLVLSGRLDYLFKLLF